MCNIFLALLLFWEKKLERTKEKLHYNGNGDIDSKARSIANCSVCNFTESQIQQLIQFNSNSNILLNSDSSIRFESSCGAPLPIWRRIWIRSLSMFTTMMMTKTTSFLTQSLTTARVLPSPIAGILVAPRVPIRFLGRRSQTELQIIPILLRYVYCNSWQVCVIVNS